MLVDKGGATKRAKPTTPDKTKALPPDAPRAPSKKTRGKDAVATALAAAATAAAADEDQDDL